MFNFGFIKQVFLFLVWLLRLLFLTFKYVLTLQKNLIVNLISFPFAFSYKIYFYVTKQFDTSRAKRWGRSFKPILITKKNAKRLIRFSYSIFYSCVSLLIFIWPLKDTVNGDIILSRYLFNSAFFTFNEIIYLSCDLKVLYILIKFVTYKYLSYVVYFSIKILPIILITIFFSEFVIRIWFTILKKSFYFLVILYFILYTLVFIKFLLILSWHTYFNIIYHFLLCVIVIQDYYTIGIKDTLDILEVILCIIEIYSREFKDLLLDHFKALLSWAASSYIYLIINLLLELITKTIPNWIIFFFNTINLFIKQIVLMQNPLYTVILNLIIIILFILIGGIIPLVERKYLSLIQRRVGPKFVGYNGRLQFIADALKLLFKEIIFLINTNKVSFVIIPIFLLNLNIFLLINLVWVNNIFYIDNEYFILLILLIELLTSIYTAYIGFVVKNKYTIIASTRLLNGVIVFEIFLITIYFYLYIINSKLSLDNVYFNQIFNLKFKINLIILPPIIYAVLLNLKKVPFDIIEAETELIMGYTTEHSGFLGGALLLIEYLHLFFWSLLILTLFLV